MTDIIEAILIVVFGCASLVVLEVCLYIVSENGIYDIARKARSQGARNDT